VIGYSGGGEGMYGAGFSTGCHLHFMVYVNGGTVDPMGWL
jgi:murein DD-endopeptidase MepM/ murein hydrolase activator NlpD